MSVWKKRNRIFERNATPKKVKIKFEPCISGSITVIDKKKSSMLVYSLKVFVDQVQLKRTWIGALKLRQFKSF